MLNCWHFIIPGQVESTNDLLGKRGVQLDKGSRGRRANLFSLAKKSHEQRIALLARAARVPTMTESVEVAVLFVENPRRDPDSPFLFVKLILDALVGAGVLPDDSWKCVHQLDVYVTRVSKGDSPGAVVAIGRRLPGAVELRLLYESRKR